MSNIKRVLLELANVGDDLDAETNRSEKNKISSKVNLDPCTCKGKGKPCGSKNCVQKKKITEGQMKRKLEDKIEKACTCDGGSSLDKSDHKKSCPAYKMLKDDDYDFGGDIDNAEYSCGDR